MTLMNPSGDAATRRTLVAAAAEVGDRLLAEAREDAAGLWWEPPPRTSGGGGGAAPGARGEYDLYSGGAGVALFLVELARVAQAERFLAAAARALAWSERAAAAEPYGRYGLYMGRTGIAAALLRLSEVSGDARPLERAVALAAPAERFLASPLKAFDLLLGTAGTVVGLLALHRATGEPGLLASAGRLLDDLLAGAQPGRRGIGWGRSAASADALCGLSHGASGIALALLEAGRHPGAEGARWAAAQALAYEDTHFDAARGNWRDLRQDCADPLLRPACLDAYRRGDRAFFTRGSQTIAWCHGAPGIGLARLRARQVLGTAEHDAAIRAALETTRGSLRVAPSDGEGLSLCHGLGGRAALFVDAYRVLGDAGHLETARQAALRTAALLRTGIVPPPGDPVRRAEPGLFIGLAGAGYFLLEAADPDGTPSIVAPRPHAGTRPAAPLPFPRSAAERAVIRAAWPCTLAAGEALAPAALDAHFAAEAGDTEAPIDRFAAFADALPASLPRDAARSLRDAAAFDAARRALDEERVSDSHTAVERALLAERAAALDLDGSIPGEVRWAPGIAAVRGGWDWAAVLEGAAFAVDAEAPGGVPTLLRRRPGGVEARVLSPAEERVFLACRDGCPAATLADAAGAGGPEAAEDGAPDSLPRRLLREGALVPAEPAGAPRAAEPVTPEPKPTMELATPEELVGQARAIGERLLRGARKLEDGSLTWGRGYGADFGPAQDPGIFSGRIGEALFFAALFVATREPEWERASLGAAQGVRARLAEEDGPARLAEEIGLGLTGVGSVIYALTRMSGFLGRPELLRDAARAATAVTPGAIDRDRVFDVFFGAAGALLGVLALADAGVEPEENLRRARACADHLLANRAADVETGLRAWATGEPLPWTGFGHGSAGIAHALLELYRRTRDEALYAAAFESFAFERELYRQELGDWPDSRGYQPGDKLISGWCHGAPGIGLSRVAAIDLARPENENGLATDLGLALERTSANPVHSVDNLCCGNLGRVDFLLEAGVRLGNASLVNRARTKAQVAIDRAAERGFLIAEGEGYEEEYMQAGMWQGLAGIGYELLRLARPNDFPSVLLLA